MAKKRTIQARLIEWDGKYAHLEKVSQLPSTNWKFHHAASWVAADIARKAGSGLNVWTWEQLEKVEKIFGRRLRKRVTFNLFHCKAQ